MNKPGRKSETVSLDGLDLSAALDGLLRIPDPDATKPKHEKAKRKKTPPTEK